MVRTVFAVVFMLVTFQYALGDQPAASGGRVHARLEPVKTEACERGCQQGNHGCSNRSSVSLFEIHAEKLAELRSRATQLPQRIPYASPMEDSFFFRPYQPTDVTKQQRSGRDPRNPYDNRFLQSIYRHSSVESHN